MAAEDPPEQQAASTFCKGACRICFEEDGELIAPCSCSGTSKWIHRSCLNHWRVSGSNPRALTNCCECKFQYVLELRRTCDLRSEEVRRQFTRQLLCHSVLGFMAIQVLIIGLGMFISLCDPHDKLVRYLPFEKVAKVAGYFPNLQHYAWTYYVAGIIALCALIGLLVSSSVCCGFRPPMHQCGICVDGCGMWFMACNPVGLCRCADLPLFGFGQFLQIMFLSSGPEILVLLGIVIVAAICIIGLLAVLAAILLVMYRVGQRYVTLQELGVLAEEYYVKDLSAPSLEDHSSVVQQQSMEQGIVAPPPDLGGESSQEEVQKLVAEELRVIFGGDALRRADDEAALRQGNAQGYGSTADS